MRIISSIIPLFIDNFLHFDLNNEKFEFLDLDLYFEFFVIFLLNYIFVLMKLVIILSF